MPQQFEVIVHGEPRPSGYVVGHRSYGDEVFVLVLLGALIVASIVYSYRTGWPLNIFKKEDK